MVDIKKNDLKSSLRNKESNKVSNKEFNKEFNNNINKNININKSINKKFFIKTYGCAHNKADSNIIRGLLKKNNYVEVDEKEADIIIINSCTVKDPSQKKAISFALKEKEKGKKVILAGCVPQANPGAYSSLPAISPKTINKIVDVIEAAFNNKILRLLEPGPNPELKIADMGLYYENKDSKLEIKKNPFINIIPISNGCLGNCSYCQTKFSRGLLQSYHPDEIINYAKKSLENGAKELWLTSEDLGAYGKDFYLRSNNINNKDYLNSNLRFSYSDISSYYNIYSNINSANSINSINIISLIKNILSLPYDFKLRIGMTNPQYVLEYLDEFIKILKHEKVYKFIHIPVQSASNRILKLMKREYTIELFEKIISSLKKEIPELTIATDFIVGFPTETELEHKKSIALIKKWEFPIINISKFYPRPGTEAKKLKQVATKIIKKRTEEMTRLYLSYNPLKLFYKENDVIEILFLERGKNNTLIGRTKEYFEVTIPKGNILLGTKKRVKIKKIHRFFLESELYKS